MSKGLAYTVMDLKEIKSIPSRLALAHLVQFQGLDIDVAKKVGRMYSFANEQTIEELKEHASDVQQ